MARINQRNIAGTVVLAGLGIAGALCLRPILAEPKTNTGPGRSAELNVAHQPPVANRVAFTIEGKARVVTGNGVPDHAVGAFPRRANPTAISAQDYRFRMALAPRANAEVLPVGHYLAGIALNGVPFDPGTAGFWRDDPRSGWNYEAIDGTLNLGLDQNNAHVQSTGAYHYHGLPTGLIEKLGANERMTLLGYAADGFPIYGPQCPADAKDMDSPLQAMKSSYRLKEGERPAGNVGPGGVYDGTFSQDYQYVAGAGDLDECNGRQGVTPEFPNGTYYYVLSANWPVLPRNFRGTPDDSFIHQPRGARGQEQQQRQREQRNGQNGGRQRVGGPRF